MNCGNLPAHIRYVNSWKASYIADTEAQLGGKHEIGVMYVDDVYVDLSPLIHKVSETQVQTHKKICSHSSGSMVPLPTRLWSPSQS